MDKVSNSIVKKEMLRLRALEIENENLKNKVKNVLLISEKGANLLNFKKVLLSIAKELKTQ
tara:strand:+ start:333 stop:515 length:183 start_codon:yes stop_codon:yes gene_type:complete